MLRTSVFCLASLFLLVSCAPQKALVKPETGALPTPIPPPLTETQLLGFFHPEGMIQDPESGHYALPEVMKAYWKLKELAKEDHWHLILVSGYRSFKSQRRIWNSSDDTYLKKGTADQKKRVEAVMRRASVPGLSRHHWGTDMDISEITLRGQLVNVEPDTPKKVLEFYKWIEENAPKYGFCKVYLGKGGVVNHEPWHWTYLPFSKAYQKQFMEIKDFKRIFDINVNDVDYLMRNFNKILNGQKGSINPACF
jgi:hypothetical protein